MRIGKTRHAFLFQHGPDSFAEFLFRHTQTVYKPHSRTMQNELDVIRDIAEKFAQAGIENMLTGSVAMNYYTQPRMTRDIDVVV